MNDYDGTCELQMHSHEALLQPQLSSLSLDFKPEELVGSVDEYNATRMQRETDDYTTMEQSVLCLRINGPFTFWLIV